MTKLTPRLPALPPEWETLVSQVSEYVPDDRRAEARKAAIRAFEAGAAAADFSGVSWHGPPRPFPVSIQFGPLDPKGDYLFARADGVWRHKAE